MFYTWSTFHSILIKISDIGDARMARWSQYKDITSIREVIHAFLPLSRRWQQTLDLWPWPWGLCLSTGDTKIATMSIKLKNWGSCSHSLPHPDFILFHKNQVESCRLSYRISTFQISPDVSVFANSTRAAHPLNGDTVTTINAGQLMNIDLCCKVIFCCKTFIVIWCVST